MSKVTFFLLLVSCSGASAGTVGRTAGCCLGGLPLRFGAAMGAPFSLYGMVEATDAALVARERLLGGMFSGYSTVGATEAEELLARALGFGTTATGGSVASSSLALFGGRPLGAGIGLGFSSPERHGTGGGREGARLLG